MRSARWMVEKRWAMITLVRCRSNRSRASCSRNRSQDPRSTSPRPTPGRADYIPAPGRRPGADAGRRRDSRPAPGSAPRSRPAARARSDRRGRAPAAASTSARVTSGCHRVMFSSTVPEKTTTSWRTRPTWRRSARRVPLPHVDALHQHRAALDVVAPREELRERALPRPAGADHRDPLPRRDAKRQPAEHPVILRRLVVREPDVAQLDHGRGGRGRPRRPGRRGDLDRRVEEPEDPLGRHHRRLHDGVLGRHVADREEEAMRVLHERDQDAEGERAGEDLAASPPDQARDRDRAHDLHRRVEDRVEDHPAEHGQPVRPRSARRTRGPARPRARRAGRPSSRSGSPGGTC